MGDDPTLVYWVRHLIDWGVEILRILLVATLLLLTGCTKHPVGAPRTSADPPATSASATVVPPSEPAKDTAEDKIGCDDIASFVDVPETGLQHNSWKGAYDVTACAYGYGNVVMFTAESDEDAFRLRRSRYVVWQGFVSDPDAGVADEAYRSFEGEGALQKSVAAARKGSVEVWIIFGPPGTWERTEFEDKIFTGLFDLLGTS